MAVEPAKRARAGSQAKMTREDRIHLLLLIIGLVWAVWAMCEAFHYRRGREVAPDDIRRTYQIK
jgi:hypothetical protein